MSHRGVMSPRAANPKAARRRVPKARREADTGAAEPNRVMLSRLRRIHDRLNDSSLHSNAKVNCSTLARQLEVSPKTIQRDLNLLRDGFELPLKYDHSQRGYYYDAPSEVAFPLGRDLTPDERVALVVARQCLEVFEGVDFGSQLRSAFDKLAEGVLGETAQGIEGRLEDYISVRTPGAGRVDPVLFRGVRIALLRSRVLEVDYKPRGALTPVRRKLHPLHLACVASRWNLVARDPDDGSIDTLVLARLSRPRVSEEVFSRPSGFDPRPYLGSVFGAGTSSGKILVRLEIAAAGVHHVQERTWHPSQRLTEGPAGAVEVSFELADLHDVARWVLGFGADCEVLAPPQLRAFVEDQGRRMARRNGNSGTVPTSLGPAGPEAFVGFMKRGAS